MKVPELPSHIRRLHLLRWNDLIDKGGFTGVHLAWHECPNRRRQAAKPTYSLLPPPSDLKGGRVEFRGAEGESIPYGKWYQNQMAAWRARENDPDVIDSIGIIETIALARTRFERIVRDYLEHWANTSGDSDAFRQWVQQVSLLVATEVRDVWRKDEWHGAWFDRACRPKVDDALTLLAREWERRATTLEMQHLANPHLSLAVLLAAEGDLGLALTLQQSRDAIESAQELLNRLNATEPVSRGNPEETDGKQFAGESSGVKRRQVPIQEVSPELLADLSGRYPLGENFFPPEHTFHQPFEDANWDAEDELVNLRAGLLLRCRSASTPPEFTKLLVAYDIDTKGGRIIVNPAEAEQVRTIFGLYVTKGSSLPVLQETRASVS